MVVVVVVDLKRKYNNKKTLTSVICTIQLEYKLKHKHTNSH